MYLSKFHNVFVHNSKFMCLKFKSLVQKVFAKHCNPDDEETSGAHRYLSKYHNVSVQISECICPNFKMYLPNTIITRIKRLVGLAGLLSSLSPFANCWIFHELLCFAHNQHLFIIDDGDDDFNDLKWFAPERYPPKIHPPKMSLPKLNLAQLPALIKLTLS